MTAADKMLQGLREAEQFTGGVAPAARLYLNGFWYVPENGVFPSGAEPPWPPTALLAGHKYGRMVHVVIMVPAEDVEKLPHERLRYVGRVSAGG